jgi:hypothetical protein
LLSGGPDAPCSAAGASLPPRRAATGATRLANAVQPEVRLVIRPDVCGDDARAGTGHEPGREEGQQAGDNAPDGRMPPVLADDPDQEAEGDPWSWRERAMRSAELVSPQMRATAPSAWLGLGLPGGVHC